MSGKALAASDGALVAGRRGAYALRASCFNVPATTGRGLRSAIAPDQSKRVEAADTPRWPRTECSSSVMLSRPRIAVSTSSFSCTQQEPALSLLSCAMEFLHRKLGTLGRENGCQIAVPALQNEPGRCAGAEGERHFKVQFLLQCARHIGCEQRLRCCCSMLGATPRTSLPAPLLA